MTLSFLWWLPIVKAPLYVKKVTCARYESVAVNFPFQIFLLFSFLLNSLAYLTIPKHNEKIKINCNKYITDWSPIYLRLTFLVKGRKKIETELINCSEGKKERDKIHCKGKESGCSKLNFVQSLPWMNKNKIQTQDTKRKRY